MTDNALVLGPSDAARYREIRLVSAGTEALVFSAVYSPIGGRVAIKVLHAPGATPAIRARREERFLREARALWETSHAHVAKVYELLDVKLEEVATKAFT